MYCEQCGEILNVDTEKTVQPDIVIVAPSAFKVKTKELFSIASICGEKLNPPI